MTDWLGNLAAKSMGGVRDLGAYGGWRGTKPGAIGLHGGLPFPDSFPAREIAEATAETMRQDAAWALQYGGGPPALRLKEYLGQVSERWGVALQGRDLLVTNGSSHAIDLACRALFDPGDLVVVEGPTFMGALRIFLSHQAAIETVRVHPESGFDIAAFESLLADRRRRGLPGPKLLYAIPNFQNPSGVTTPLVARQRLVELAGEHNFVILEDDAYGELSFDGSRVPSLASLPGGERVVYCSTLSKLVAPGVRLGWAVAPTRLIEWMGSVKSDGGTSPFASSVVARYAADGRLERRIPELRAAYRRRCELTLTALETHMPPGTSWTRPTGGFFFWVTLPEGMDSQALWEISNDKGVNFLPGHWFYPPGDPRGGRHLRLSYSFAPEAELPRGIEMLAEAIRESSQR